MLRRQTFEGGSNLCSGAQLTGTSLTSALKMQP